MSVRELSDDRPEDIRQFTRWPGLLNLSLGVLLGPIVALVDQSIIYAGNSWTCGRDIGATLHIAPALSLVVVIGAGFVSFLNWRAVGRGVEDEHGAVLTRTRFLSLLGMAISAFSAVVILGMWLSIFVFAPCMRA